MRVFLCLIIMLSGKNSLNNIMNIKNVIFDSGAVMFDWNPEKITKKFTDNVELQKRIQTELYYHQDWIDFDCAVITEKEAISRASERLEISLVETKKLFAQTKESLVLMPKTFELLKKVKSKDIKTYCLSNISPELFKYLFDRYNLFNLFDGIVTSGAENVAKPDKRIFEILFERYELKPQQCLFIDDSEANTATASMLGVSSITFKGTEACYNKIKKYL